MNRYIYKINNSLIGRTILKLKNDNIDFKKNDIIYFADQDNIIHSRWTVANTNNGVLLRKNTQNIISLNYEELFGEKYNKKVNKLEESDALVVEKYFIHNIKIYPYYDLNIKEKVLNKVVKLIKDKDLNVEVYINVFTNNASNIVNGFCDQYNLIIDEHFGVITFKCIEEDVFIDNEKTNELLDELNSIDKIKTCLLNSAFLTTEEDELKINYQKYYIIETEKEKEYLNKINVMLKEKGYEEIYIVTPEMFMDKILANIKSGQCISKEEHYGILQMLMPQYVISKTKKTIAKNLEFFPDGAYELDDNQKAVLREMNKRVYLKAAAGSGKTILLLSKAYEVAISNPDKDFLLICFNRKLAEDMNIQAENTGKIKRNLTICNLDQFIKNDNYSDYESDDENETFVTRRKIFINKVSQGKINKKYAGIFIDEMQQMDEEWIIALSMCLDENKYMVLAGDYYQQIRSDQEDLEDIVLENENNKFKIGELEFEKILLNYNYRNSFEISSVLRKMLKHIQKKNEQLKVPVKKEESIIVSGISTRKTRIKPKYFHVENEKEEIDKIIEEIEILINKKQYMPNDILLISPWGKSSSHLIWTLKQNMKSMGLEICDFYDNPLKKDGIRIGTIGKAIGLDYKAVILFGTNMMKDSRIKKLKFDRLTNIEDEELQIKDEFIKYLKNIYVAASRARDDLIVINDIKDEFNLISLFLKLVEESNDE